MLGPDGRALAATTFQSDAPGRWTPAMTLQPVSLPPGEARAGLVEITLRGENAQLWRYGGKAFFPDHLLAGP